MRKISPPLKRLDAVLRRIVSTPKVDIDRLVAREERKRKKEKEPEPPPKVKAG
jgi:hypothetical protein